jgi:hypothetical protein
MPAMQRLLLILGLSMVVAGLLWPWLSKLPWGRLPGDISIEGPVSASTFLSRRRS